MRVESTDSGVGVAASLLLLLLVLLLMFQISSVVPMLYSALTKTAGNMVMAFSVILANKEDWQKVVCQSV